MSMEESKPETTSRLPRGLAGVAVGVFIAAMFLGVSEREASESLGAVPDHHFISPLLTLAPTSSATIRPAPFASARAVAKW